MRGDTSRAASTHDWLNEPEGADARARMDLFELVRLKGHLLLPEERSFLEAYLRGSNSLRQIARLAGMKPSTAWRRVRRLARRLYAGANLVCLEQPCGLTAEELAIVRDHVVRGFSMQEISRIRKLSYYRVRHIILTAKTLTHADRARGGRRRTSGTRACPAVGAEPSEGSSV